MASPAAARLRATVAAGGYSTTLLKGVTGSGKTEVYLEAVAETLKARAYDGDLARVRVPADADVAWLRAVADPADDLRVPMKGPLFTDRDGDTAAHRAAIALAKSAQLLPAVVLVQAEPPPGLTPDRFAS